MPAFCAGDWSALTIRAATTVFGIQPRGIQVTGIYGGQVLTSNLISRQRQPGHPW